MCFAIFLCLFIYCIGCFDCFGTVFLVDFVSFYFFASCPCVEV